MGRLIDEIDEEYCCVQQYNSYSKLKKILLYPTTLLSGNVLGILTGVATGLSINILTNFLSFDKDTLWEFALLLCQFVAAIIFNVGLISFTLRCTFKDKIAPDYKLPEKERIRKYKTDIISTYENKYPKIKHSFLVTVISFVLVIILAVIILIVIFCINHFA